MATIARAEGFHDFHNGTQSAKKRGRDDAVREGGAGLRPCHLTRYTINLGPILPRRSHVDRFTYSAYCPQSILKTVGEGAAFHRYIFWAQRMLTAVSQSALRKASEPALRLDAGVAEDGAEHEEAFWVLSALA